MSLVYILQKRVGLTLAFSTSTRSRLEASIHQGKGPQLSVSLRMSRETRIRSNWFSKGA